MRPSRKPKRKVLVDAARHGRVDEAERVLAVRGELTFKRYLRRTRWQVIRIAAAHGRTEFVRWLLDGRSKGLDEPTARNVMFKSLLTGHVEAAGELDRSFGGRLSSICPEEMRRRIGRFWVRDGLAGLERYGRPRPLP